MKDVVFDVNGTLAVDGKVLPGVPELLIALQDQVSVHLLTADTHGKQSEIDLQLGLKAVRIKPGEEARQKSEYVMQLGADSTVAIGQGANDSSMLKTARIGICILSAEGAALDTMLQSDLVVPDITSAIELLLKPKRLVASLRK
ncbi:MAG: hypothetical protein MUP11_04355 [Anaerolineales bacterium]|nr:hypothetical protein [Anaerolineales bacterium]